MFTCENRADTVTKPLSNGCKVLVIMATRHITQTIDDLDGTVLDQDGVRNITFTVEGRSYEIDLSESNAERFHTALAPFVDAARSTRVPGTTGRRREDARAKSDLDLGAIREWARANGHTVSDRGRVSSAVVDAYKSATA
ncbi:Lsr2 family protein [Microbacterium sp. VKM Ac-2923]|uniref:histone-like nucleoid-structuring protein Lsr2 n=1 Tax=Microbacterium sp. VKM Ac-2923 TaxID=2929476 RepID=UPI001FB2B3AA|nr:Lsr2 family protein [Microbacterium sp. VKM Ac-2923]MCJ1709413.1 Lsr2 family protein [Microbacterium sp. VKM Ac-2923]